MPFFNTVNRLRISVFGKPQAVHTRSQHQSNPSAVLSPVPLNPYNKRSWNIGTKVLVTINDHDHECIIHTIELSSPWAKTRNDDRITVQYNNRNTEKFSRWELKSSPTYIQNRKKLTKYCMIEVYVSSSKTWIPSYIHNYPETVTNGNKFCVNDREYFRWDKEIRCHSELLQLETDHMCLIFDTHCCMWCYGKIVGIKEAEKTENGRPNLDIFEIKYQKRGKIYVKYVHQFSASLIALPQKHNSELHKIEQNLNNATFAPVFVQYYRTLCACDSDDIDIPDHLLSIIAKYVGYAPYELVMAIESQTGSSAMEHREHAQQNIAPYDAPHPMKSNVGTLPDTELPVRDTVSKKEHDVNTNSSVFEETEKTLPSYRGFCDALKNWKMSSCINERNITALNQYIIPCIGNHADRLNEFLMISIANKTPIAQFIVDKYCECAFVYDMSIDQFMEKSIFLSMLYHDIECWNLIKRYLYNYSALVYKPIRRNMFEDGNNEDDDDEDQDYDEYMTDNDQKHQAKDYLCNLKHNMYKISEYISIISNNIYKLKNVSQLDVVFIPGILHRIDGAYFKSRGIQYQRFNNKKCIGKMMEIFNKKLEKKRLQFKRCILLIMDNNHICNDIVYIFLPLKNHSVPTAISAYTELPFICNTKCNILPGVNVQNTDSLCISFHRHFHGNKVETTRVYLSCGSYCVRLFKYNINDVLSVFCEGEECLDLDTDFNDHQYHAFEMTYFGDLQLVKPNLNDYWMEQMHYECRWSQMLSQYFISDRRLTLKSEQQYMYKPSPMKLYQYMNQRINEYYESHGVRDKNNQFLNYILENELDDCCLEDNWIDIDDCVLLNFDNDFPLSNVTIDRDHFVFVFLQSIYCFLSKYV